MIGRFFISIILLIVARILQYLFLPFMVFYGIISSIVRWELWKYLTELAIGIDVFGNIAGKYALNDFVYARNFGNRLQTISCTMGLNEDKKISKFGRFIIFCLNKLEKNHCKKAVENHKQNITKEFLCLKETQKT